MSLKVPEHRRLPYHPLFGRMDSSMGNNGVFRLLNREAGRTLNIIASDGMGWEHVSVSVFNSTQTPSWSDMALVKDTFWGEEDAVMQLHPPKSQYVNNHPGCLHLWRPVDQEIPLPLAIFVGDKDLTPDEVGAMSVRELAREMKKAQVTA